MIKAIQTSYNGYSCRSRTEARWMVAFDEAKIKYEYEPQGFDLGEVGWYLPDFYLPQIDTYAEVKGRKFTLQELKKARALADWEETPVLLLEGSPARKGYWSICPWNSKCYEAEYENESFRIFAFDIFYSEPSMHLHVHEDQYEIKQIRSSEYYCDENSFPNSHYCGYEESESEAVMAARSARFEHGESGPTRISDDDFIGHDEIIERAKALQFQDEIDEATEWMRNNPFGHWGVLGRSGKSFKE